MPNLEQLEPIGRTPTEWRCIADALEHWYGSTLNEGMLGNGEDVDDGLDLIEEIRLRFGGEDA